jgi:hypothetical protein
VEASPSGHRQRDILLAAGALLLLAVGLVRLAVPDRSRIRPLSIEALEVAGDRLDPGQTMTRDANWNPPDDVYLLGWHPWIAAPADMRFNVEISAFQGTTRLLFVAQNLTPPGIVTPWSPQLLPQGTGIRLLKGQPLTMRYRITNTGAVPFETGGATALLYFVPVEGN